MQYLHITMPQSNSTGGGHVKCWFSPLLSPFFSSTPLISSHTPPSPPLTLPSPPPLPPLPPPVLLLLSPLQQRSHCTMVSQTSWLGWLMKNFRGWRTASLSVTWSISHRCTLVRLTSLLFREDVPLAISIQQTELFVTAHMGACP